MLAASVDQEDRGSFLISFIDLSIFLYPTALGYLLAIHVVGALEGAQ